MCTVSTSLIIVFGINSNYICAGKVLCYVIIHIEYAVRVSQSYIQFSQKLLVSTIIFAALTQGRFSTLSSVFSDEAWRLLPGETSINSRKNISAFYRQNIKKRKFSLVSLAYHSR